MAICTKCKEEKEDWEFNMDNSRANRLTSQCRECVRKFRQNSEQSFKDRLWNCFGMTIIEYEMILESQNGVCAICGKIQTQKDCNGRVVRLAVDHCHKTGKIRGLLCSGCNGKLGSLEDENWIPKALAYLKEHK